MLLHIIQHNVYTQAIMDFRKKQLEAKSTKSRWGNLKNDDDTNAFQTVKKKTRHNKREEENNKSCEKQEHLLGEIPLSGIVEKNEKYVAPGKKSRDNKTSKTSKSSKSTGLSLSKNRNKKVVKPLPPDRKDESLFPTLESSINIEHKNNDENNENHNNNHDNDDNHDDDDNIATFADLVTFTDSPVKKEKIVKDDIKPGWIRLSRGPNGELVKEYGTAVPKSQFWINWEHADEQKKRQALIDTLERNMAYVRWAFPYEKSYEPSEDDYDSSDDYEEEWVSEEEN